MLGVLPGRAVRGPADTDRVARRGAPALPADPAALWIVPSIATVESAIKHRSQSKFAKKNLYSYISLSTFKFNWNRHLMTDASGAPAGGVHAQGVVDHQELLAVRARDDLAAGGAVIWPPLYFV